MTLTWVRQDIVMYGTCPRLMLNLPIGTAYLESHSKECQKKAHSPRGWTLKCEGLRLNVALDAKEIDAARKEATSLIVAALEALLTIVRRLDDTVPQSDLLGRAWLDPAGDRWEAVLVGSGNMEGWTLFARASAPVRPNKTEWKRGPDVGWKELS